MVTRMWNFIVQSVIIYQCSMSDKIVCGGSIQDEFMQYYYKII